MLLIMIILCLILLIALADDLQKFISSNQSVWQGSIFKVRHREREREREGRGRGREREEGKGREGGGKEAWREGREAWGRERDYVVMAATSVKETHVPSP